MHYLVDAYNLLFRFLKKGKSLEDRRRQLIEEINRAAQALNLQITLVFDGADDYQSYPTRGHFDCLELVYTSKNKTADEYISEEVIHSKNAAEITVVTNDRELASRCKDHHAKIKTIDGFIGFLSKKKAKKKKSSPSTSRIFNESSSEFARLLAIFEKRLNKE